MGKLFLMISIFCTLSASALAQTTGRDLLHKCEVITHLQSEQNSTDSLAYGLYCMGYVTGILDLIEDAQIQSGTPSNEGFHVCLPNTGITNEETTRVVVKWLQDHPAKLHIPAPQAVVAALKLAYPCH